MTTDADKIRYLAELAGWEPDDCGCDYPECSWKGFFKKGSLVARLDYPNSLDAINRDLLPLLCEKGWEYELIWNGEEYTFSVWEHGLELAERTHNTEPARAAFEAIFEALHGGEE